MPKRTETKRRGSRKTYILCAAALILLVTAAFMMPQVVLLLQDSQDRNVIHLGTRSELKYAAADIEYELDRYNRMKSFAEGCEQGRQYFIASSDYSGSENDEELREKALLQQEWYWYVAGNEFSKEFPSDINILKKEYLVIYDNDPDNGASFVCWYLQFEQSSSDDDKMINKIKINLLVDAKDFTVYYLDMYYDIPENEVTNIYRKINLDENVYAYLWYYFTSDNIIIENSTEAAEIEYIEPLNSSVLVTDTGIEKKLYYGDNSLTMEIINIEDNYGNMLGFHMGIKEILDLLPADKKEIR